MKNSFDLAFINLGTGEHIIKSVSNLDEYYEGMQIVNPTSGNDVEVEFIDGEITGAAANSIDWILEKLEEGYELKDLEAVFNAYESVEDAERSLENSCYVIIEADNKFEAFETYIKEYSDELQGIPEHLNYYIDFELMCNDWEAGGLIIERVGNKTYLIDNMNY